MRFAFASDIHGRWPPFQRTLRLARDAWGGLPGVFVVAGDIGPDPGAVGHEAYNETTTAILSTPRLFGAEHILWVPGNHDLPRPHVELQGSTNLDGLSRTWWHPGADASFFGIGGGGPAKFGWPYEWSEEELKHVLSVRDPGSPPDVLVTHSPPWKILDEAPRGDGLFEHCGSRTVRRFIDRYLPELVICGHIHEGMGVHRDEHTTYINAGSFGNPVVGERVWMVDNFTLHWIDVNGGKGTYEL